MPSDAKGGYPREELERMEELDELRKDIVSLIGHCIDEEPLLTDPESFVEMDHGVVHLLMGERNVYFRLILKETTKEEYFKPYEP